MSGNKTYALYDEYYPQGEFELTSVLKMFRDGRDGAVGMDIADRMDRATAELEAADPLPRVPHAGDTASTFELPNQNGDVVSLKSLLAVGPAVVVFYRGAWCPYCNLTLRAYQQLSPQISTVGGSLVAISIQRPDDSVVMAERNDLSYEILSDYGARTSREYGLVFELPEYLQEAYVQLGHPLPAFNGTWELPMPATFVIDTDWVVRFAEANPDYTERADPQDVLSALRAAV